MLLSIMHLESGGKCFVRKKEIDKSKDDVSQIMVIQDFLAGKGLPKKISDDFELHHLLQVVEEFNRSPK